MGRTKLAHEIVYHWNGGFRFKLDHKVDYSHEITENQFFRAKDTIQEMGFLLVKGKGVLSDIELLLDGHYIKISGINEIQGSNSSRYLQIKSEDFPESFRTRKLIELLDLPLPRE